jgi:hypothetical protein
MGGCGPGHPGPSEEGNWRRINSLEREMEDLRRNLAALIEEVAEEKRKRNTVTVDDLPRIV